VEIMIFKRRSIVFLLSVSTILFVSCSNGTSPLFPEKSISNDSWLITWGGPENDMVYGQEISADGEIVISTILNSPPVGPPYISETYDNEDLCAGLTKYDSSGRTIWSHFWEGDSYITICDILCDTSGNIYMGGFFSGTINFDPFGNNEERTSKGTYNIFLTKYDLHGNHLWTSTWGDRGNEICRFIASDNSGNIILGGNGSRPDEKSFNTALSDREVSLPDEYICKFDQNGNLLWITETSYSKLIASDINNCIYIAGTYSGTYDFDPGPDVDEITSNGLHIDIYISKYDENGEYLWTKSWGGELFDDVTDMHSSSSGMIICVGKTEVLDIIDPKEGKFHDHHYLNCFDSEGDLFWSKTWGSEKRGNQVFGCEIDQNENIYVIGEFSGTVDFDPGPGEEIQTGTQDHPDSYLSKFDLNGNFLQASTWSRNGNIYSRLINVDESGGIYISGSFSGETEFTFGRSTVIRNSSELDAFFMRISQEDLLNTD
jgi:hypothetical protein